MHLFVAVPNNRVCLKTIVAQCEEDYELLNRCLNDLNEAGLRTKINTWFRPRVDHAGPPMSDEEVRSRFYLWEIF